MRFRSRTLAAVPVLVLGLLGPTLPLGQLPVASVATAGTVIVQQDRVIDEDLYAAGTRVIIEGTIRGDLIVLARQVDVRGTVEGDVLGVAFDIDIDGEVGGSVRATAWDVTVTGRVGDDLLAFARHVELDGSVGRDFLMAGVSADVDGTVGRELRGEFLWGLTIEGAIERNVDVGVHRLRVTDTARVEQALTYRQGWIGQNVRGWAGRFVVDEGADVGIVAEVQPLPTELSVRAFRTLLQVLRFLGFLLVGVLFIGVTPRFARSAVEMAGRRPLASAATGLAVILLTPVLALAAFLTIVLIPLALTALGVWLPLLFVGAAPAVIAFGRWVTRDRTTLIGSLVAGALVWRLLRFIPLAGLAIYWLATAWGIGALLLALAGRWRNQGAIEPPSEEPGDGQSLVDRLALLGLTPDSGNGGDGSPDQ